MRFFDSSLTNAVQAPVGAPLMAHPRLLTITFLAAALLVGADMAVAAITYDQSLRFTLALFGSLFCAFVSSTDALAGTNTFGFRLIPRQGWHFWIKAGLTAGAALVIIVLVVTDIAVILGYNLPPSPITRTSQIWPLFVGMCITAPLFEEILYRLVFCPPVTALVGARSCILLNGLAFGGLHIIYGNPSPENLLGGFILSWAFLKSETLIIPILLHASGNLCALLSQIVYFVLMTQ